LDNKVFDIIDARCNYEIHSSKYFLLHFTVVFRLFLKIAKN